MARVVERHDARDLGSGRPPGDRVRIAGGPAPRRVDRRGRSGTGDPSRASGAPGLTYRPALDGLRAVAVLAVMAEHAQIRLPGASGPLVPGGFLGVDVFFVISGFLITALLLVEHRSTGGVDLRRFWVRRARRLLPASALLIVATSALVGSGQIAVDPAAARGDALSALAYVSNWHFIVTDQSYFASFGLPSPFRHLWSLSLEEQWYLLFPPVLLVAAARLRRRPGVLLAGVLAAAAASAAWMAVVFVPGRDPSRAYYGTDTRAHTLLVGVALAVVMVRFPAATRRVRTALPVLAVVGVGALGVLFATVDGRTPALYEGGFLVVAVASAAAVAGLALPGAAGPVHRVLAWRAPVLVGRLSYGLYLWHWPLFVWLTPDRTGLDGARLAGARFAAAFLAAGVSYVVVERPFRARGFTGLSDRLRGLGLPRVRPLTFGALTAGAVVAAVVAATAPVPVPATEPTLAWADAPAPTLPAVRPVTTTVVEPGHPLPGVPVDQPLDLMFVGDSVSWVLAHHLDRQDLLAPGTRSWTIANLGCTLTPGAALVNGAPFPADGCVGWRDAARTVALENQPDLVIGVWGAWEVYDHVDGDELLVAGTAAAADAYRDELAASIDELVAVAPDIRFAYLLVPCMDEVDPRLGGEVSPRNDPANLAWANRLTAEVAASYGDRVVLVDLGPLLCRGGEAVDEVGGVRTRGDGVHFTAEYAPVVWEHVEQRVRPWLATPAEAPL